MSALHTLFSLVYKFSNSELVHSLNMHSPLKYLAFLLAMLLLHTGLCIIREDSRPPIFSRPQFDSYHVEEASSGGNFRHLGQTVGSISYGHVIFDVDLRNITTSIRQACRSTPASWELAKKWKGAPRTGSDSQWLGRILTYKCLTVESDLLQIEKVFRSQMVTDTDAPGRNKRQFVIGSAIALGVVAGGSAVFSLEQLLHVSSNSGTSHHVVQVLQDHETRVTVDEASIRRLNLTTAKLGFALAKESREVMFLRESLLYTTILSSVLERTTAVTRGLLALLHDKFSPDLIHMTTVITAVEQVSRALMKRGFTLSLANPEDIFRLHASHLVFNNDTLRIFVHIPAYRDAGVMTLYEYVPSPLLMLNADHHSKFHHEVLCRGFILIFFHFASRVLSLPHSYLRDHCYLGVP